MDAVQVFICFLIGLLLGYLIAIKRKDENEDDEDGVCFDTLGDTCRKYIDDKLIPTMCIEDLDDMLVFDDSADTKMLIYRGYFLGCTVSRLHELVAKLKPELSYVGHVVLRDSKIKFDAGVGGKSMLYYKRVGLVGVPLLNVDVDFSEASLDRLTLYFSGPLAVDVINLWNSGEEVLKDISNEREEMPETAI